MGKKSRHLTDNDIESIIELCDGWDGSLTWEALCVACVGAIGFKPTRHKPCISLVELLELRN